MLKFYAIMDAINSIFGANAEFRDFILRAANSLCLLTKRIYRDT